MVPEGVQRGAGSNFFRVKGVGAQLLISIETFRTCEFPGPAPLNRLKLTCGLLITTTYYRSILVSLGPMEKSISL